MNILTITEKAGRVKKQLKTGKENALTIKEISGLTGISSRSVNEAVRYLRINGVIVCGDRKDSKGLYIANTLDEAGQSLATLKAQAISLYEVCEAMEKAIAEAFSKSKQIDILTELRKGPDEEKDTQERDSSEKTNAERSHDKKD